MRLRGLGVIRDAVLELGPGLTVVTGETGAGKTMVVTGLGLLMGGRSDAGAVRSGEPAAVVEGRVLVDPAGPVAARALEAGAALDDDGDLLVISRSVSAEGRSRAHLGGRSVPVGVLAELADELVTVHGQGEAVRLRSATHQRQALDRYAGSAVLPELDDYRTGWLRLRVLEDELGELTAKARERSQEAELLRLGLAEVERIAPQPGEDAELKAEAARLSHAEDLRGAATTAQALLSGDSEQVEDGADAGSLVGAARQALDAARSHDPQLAELADRVTELGYLAADIAAECASYVASVDADPARLAAVEQRRAELGQLSRTHGTDVDGVLAWAEHSGLRLLELDGDDDRIGAMAADRDRLRADLGRLAGSVSRARTAAAAKLADAVSAELQQLSMPDARLVVEVRQRPDPDGLTVDLGSGPQALATGPDGVDEVELQLVPHQGAPARPLAKGASGGELARVMLGLEVVLGAVDPVPTFVFDEVDAGVGGRAALGIGRRLARLARGSQVLVVTHLAQVAAFADRHLLVAKGSDGEVTESGVHRLQGEDQVRELARMLGGVDDSDSARAHAEELLALAAEERSGPPPARRKKAR
jgi:DNA repair protein RecN (Recombination protein N)